MKKNWFYFDNEGVAAVNTTRMIDGKNYSFDRNGVYINIK